MVIVLNESSTEAIKLALVGNPNVGKSTLFNLLTKQTEHTGNWIGKTVSTAKSVCYYNNIIFEVSDLPGTYSLKFNSSEEKIATENILNNNYDVLIIVVNSLMLSRSMLLTMQTLMRTQKVVLCLNMSDDAKKKKIEIDTDELSLQLGIPVVDISARKNHNIEKLLDKAISVASGEIKTFSLSTLTDIKERNLTYKDEVGILSQLGKNIVSLCYQKTPSPYSDKDRFLDKLFTSRITGIPLTVLFFAVTFWITAFAANYPSSMLSNMFASVIKFLKDNFSGVVNNTILSIFTDGILMTVGWVVSVMLPPALIFFILFALLEESGYLPRIAFNLDRLFRFAGISGKSSITMLMGLGCNACGVTGCRIMNSKKERVIGILTNSFIPCNGRFPTLIAISSVFIASGLSSVMKSAVVALVLLLLLFLSFAVTLLVSFVLSKTAFKDDNSKFIFELPPYRKPPFIKTITNALKEKVLYVLLRAVVVSVPAGLVLWLLTNIHLGNRALIICLSDFLHPFGTIVGLNGIILTGFILGFPANEIVLPIILMIYTNSETLTEYTGLSELGTILVGENWTITTAICFIVFTLFHFPCSTTCFSIYKETRSIKRTIASILIPLCVGVVLCAIINAIALIF